MCWEGTYHKVHPNGQSKERPPTTEDRSEPLSYTLWWFSSTNHGAFMGVIQTQSSLWATWNKTHKPNSPTRTAHDVGEMRRRSHIHPSIRLPYNEAQSTRSECAATALGGILSSTMTAAWQCLRNKRRTMDEAPGFVALSPRRTRHFVMRNHHQFSLCPILEESTMWTPCLTAHIITHPFQRRPSMPSCICHLDLGELQM